MPSSGDQRIAAVGAVGAFAQRNIRAKLVHFPSFGNRKTTMAAAQDAQSLFNSMVDKDGDLFWMIVSFEGNADVPVVVASGKDGFNACKKALDNGKILHGVVKVLGVDNRGNVCAVRPKYVAFTWVGPSVSALKRGQAGPQRDKLKKVFHGLALELQIDDADDFTQESVARRLLASGGAHKPTEYRFAHDAEPDVITIEQLIGQKHT